MVRRLDNDAVRLLSGDDAGYDVCIIFSAIVSSVPAVFMQKIIAVIEDQLAKRRLERRSAGRSLPLVGTVGAVLRAVADRRPCLHSQLMAVITQGSLKKLREKMFNGMQNLPIKYFDTHNHGDIMSHYTNDIDTLRQMISQSFPQLLVSGNHRGYDLLHYDLLLRVADAGCAAGVALMLMITKKVGGGSAKYFFRQQTALGKDEGFVEEMMNGQKVVKVFCHEEESEADFERINEELFDESESANKYANTLGPILNNIGNVLYVMVAVVGGLLLLPVPPISAFPAWLSASAWSCLS